MLTFFLNMNVESVAAFSPYPLFVYTYMPFIMSVGLIPMWLHYIFHVNVRIKKAISDGEQKKSTKYVAYLLFILGSVFLIFFIMQIEKRVIDIQTNNLWQYDPWVKGLYYEDEIQLGFAYGLQESLKRHPDAEKIYISSGGGIVQEAIVAARMLRDNNFHTIVVEDICFSACTVLFFSMKNRKVNEDAEISIHGCEMQDQHKKVWFNFSKQVLLLTIENLFEKAQLDKKMIKIALSQGCDDGTDLIGRDLIKDKVASFYPNDDLRALVYKKHGFKSREQLRVEIRDAAFKGTPEERKELDKRFPLRMNPLKNVD